MRTDTFDARSVVELALKKGADQAEVFFKSTDGLSIEVNEGRLDAAESSSASGFSIRIIKAGRPGFSYATGPEDPAYAVDAAIESSGFAAQDPFLGFPESAPPASHDLGLYDPAIASVSEEKAVSMALDIESAARADKRIKRIRKASASFGTSKTIICNSNGVFFEAASTSASADVMAMAEDAGDSQIGWDYASARFLSDIDFRSVGKTAASRAARLLGAKKISACKVPIILDNMVSVEFLGIFASLLSSESVQKGKSLLAGKKGQTVISPHLSIIDDGLMHRGMGTRAVDDEGVSSMKKSLIEKGMLSEFMYNTYTARKDGVRSTGNARRPGAMSPPSVGPSNLYLASDAVFDDMLGALGTGLLITDAMGIHTANPISGEFSIGISGVWIEGGREAHPVKEAVISGNILDFMSKVEGAARDTRFYGNMGSPSILVGPVDISA